MTIVRQNGLFWDVDDGGKLRKISDTSLPVLELRGLIDNVAQKEFLIGEAVRESGEYAAFAESLADFTGSELYSVVEGVCFAGRDCGITELIIPNGVHTVKSSGFRGFAALAEVSAPESLIAIEGSAFCGCSALTTFELPPALEELGAGAFSGTAISEFRLPSSLLRVSGNPFPKGSTVYVPMGLTRDVYYAVSSLPDVRIRRC